MTTGRVFAAEMIGTFILVLGGVGTAVLAGDRVGMTGVALAFGAALVVAIHATRPVSGGHLNPAVSLGMMIMRRIDSGALAIYWAAQLVGAVLAALVVWLVADGALGGFDADPTNFATNRFGVEYGLYALGSVIIAEVVLTAVFVFVVLSTTNEGFPVAAGGLTIGLAYAVTHLVAIPIDNASIHPARSLAVALFAGGESLTQVWVFVLFPLLGGFLGVLAWLMVDDESIEDTILVDTPLDEIRDAVEEALD